jgi:hypothetical protein
MEMINNEYWLDYAKKEVDNSVTSVNDAAAKLEKMVLWFWSLYTASFTIGVSINAIDAPTWVLILLASPIVLLIMTYWLCVWAQLPILSHHPYDPRVPVEIIKAYNFGQLKKDRHLRFAQTLSLVAALFLGIALFSFSFVHKKEATVMNALYNASKNTILISGTLPKNTLVNTYIDSVDREGNKKEFYVNSFLVQDNGVLNINVPVNDPPKEVVVSTFWKDNNVEKGFTQKLRK